MTDNELLELSAKAAGYEPARMADDDSGLLLRGAQEPWNPLEDDGDAFRLAVCLGFEVRMQNHLDRSHVVTTKPLRSWFTAPHNDDPYAATRRAIVRAAAEIGKMMEGGDV